MAIHGYGTYLAAYRTGKIEMGAKSERPSMREASKRRRGERGFEMLNMRFFPLVYLSYEQQWSKSLYDTKVYVNDLCLLI